MSLMESTFRWYFSIRLNVNTDDIEQSISFKITLNMRNYVVIHVLSKSLVNRKDI